MKLKTFDDLVAEIKDEAGMLESPCLVALDGRSGTGKTTLSKRLGHALGPSVILGDDFYSGGRLEEWADRSPRDKVENCMDWRRMRSEALQPLLDGKTAHWRTFNWETGMGLSEELITCQPSSFIILDGTFSGRPELADIVNVSVLLKMPEDVRRRRLNDREGEAFMDKWHVVWAVCEDLYFTQIRTESDYDIVIYSADLETEA